MLATATLLARLTPPRSPELAYGTAALYRLDLSKR
jgi:hypothetical protein